MGISDQINVGEDLCDQGIVLEAMEVSDSGIINARVKIAMDSIWFEGHFPDDPLLPGIAQLSMVLTIMEKALGKRFDINTLSRVRFKQPVRPGSDLSVRVVPGNEDLEKFSFEVKSGDGDVLTGTVQVNK